MDDDPTGSAAAPSRLQTGSGTVVPEPAEAAMQAGLTEPGSGRG